MGLEKSRNFKMGRWQKIVTLIFVNQDLQLFGFHLNDGANPEMNMDSATDKNGQFKNKKTPIMRPYGKSPGVRLFRWILY